MGRRHVECPQTCSAFQTCEPSIRRNASKRINDGYLNGLLGSSLKNIRNLTAKDIDVRKSILRLA
ncbi:MAG: hypothetical protein VB137_15755 [Burkholderia sp.]